MSDITSSNIEASSIEGSALPNPIPKEYKHYNESVGDSILSSSPGDQNNQLGVSQSAAEFRRVVEKKPFKFCENLAESSTFFEPIDTHKRNSVIKEENIGEEEQKETEGSTEQSKFAKSSIIERINQETDEKIEMIFEDVERFLVKKENCEEIVKKMEDLREKSPKNQTKDLICLKEIFEKSVKEPRKADINVSKKITQTMENFRKNEEIVEFFENFEKDEEIKNIMMEKGVMEAEWQLNKKIEEKISPILQKALEKFLRDLKLQFENFEKKIDVKAFFEVKMFEFRHLIPKNKGFGTQNWVLGLGVLSGVIGIVQLLRKMKKSGAFAIGLGVAISLLSMRKKDKNKDFELFFEEIKGKKKEISLKLMADVEEYMRTISEEAESLDLSENEEKIRNSFAQLEHLLKN